MTTLKFDFNMAEMEKRGYTVDGFMKPIRERLAEDGITEIEALVFAGEGEHCTGAFLTLVCDMDEESTEYLSLLNSLVLNIDGDFQEDAIEEMREFHAERAVRIA